MTNVPRPTFDVTGFIPPSEADILAGVLADLNAAFGGNLNPDLETPQGQLASSFAAAIGNVNDVMLSIISQVDPAYSEGKMQEAIGRIYFMERIGAVSTTVDVTCSGLPGVSIPAGALAKSAAGDVYACTSGGVIGATGSVVLAFHNVEPGPVACPAGTLNTIYQSIPGWDSVLNAGDGIPGRLEESREEFEIRRAASVARNALGYIPAIRAALMSLPGVIDAYVTENPTAASVTIGGVSVSAYSLYACVSGGVNADIAKTLWQKKPPGIPYSGSTTVTVEDDMSGYLVPYPTYVVKFTPATTLPFIAKVQLFDSADIPANSAALIQQVILDAFVGADGGERARIGATVFADRFYAGIKALGPWARIVDLTMGSNLASSASFTASFSGTVMTVSSVASGTLAVGDTIQGLGIRGLKIVSLGTGSGGTGTYNLNQGATASSTAVLGVRALLREITPHINQIPTIAAADIEVVEV